MVAGQWDFTCPACSAVAAETETCLLLVMNEHCQSLTGKRPFRLGQMYVIAVWHFSFPPWPAS